MRNGHTCNCSGTSQGESNLGPLCGRAADKTEAQTRPRKEARLPLFSHRLDAFSSQQSALTDLPAEVNTRLIKKAWRLGVGGCRCSSASLLPSWVCFQHPRQRPEAPAATDVPQRLLQRAGSALSGPSLFGTSEVHSLMNSPRPAPRVCRRNEFIKADQSKLLQQRSI